MAEGESGDAQAELRRDFVPKSDYVSADFDRLEFARLWPRVWQIACREEELQALGDYVNYEIGEESILIVRTAVDCIRAFYNVCSHRGRRLQTQVETDAVVLAYQGLDRIIRRTRLKFNQSELSIVEQMAFITTR